MSDWFKGLLGAAGAQQQQGGLTQQGQQQAWSGQSQAGQLGTLHQAWYNLQAQQQAYSPPKRRVTFKASEEIVEIDGQEIFRWRS